MNETKPPNEPDRLQRIVDAFVDLSVPTGPDNEANQRLVAALRREEAIPVELSTPSKQGARTMRRITSLAAAVLSAVAIGWIIMQMSANPSQAFAAMLEQIQTIRTATFTTEIAMEGLSEPAIKTTLLEPAWMRQDIHIKDVEFVQIFNMREGRAMSLSPKDKVATLIEISGIDEHQRKMNIIEDFRKIAGEDATFLGRENVDGISTLKYQVDQQGEYFVVWLDPASNLPVKVEMTDVADPKQASSRLTMTDFVWNAEIDESVFTFEPPEGYELKQHALDAGDSGVDRFVELLRFIVRLNNDEFLEELNTMTIVTTIQKQVMKQDGTKEEREKSAKEKLAYALNRPDLVDMDLKQRMEYGTELAQTFSHGAAFMESIWQTQHWHYQGKGVKLGEADKIVAWWYPKKEKAEAGADLDTAHVLYGDLRIETMSVDEWPQGNE